MSVSYADVDNDGVGELLVSHDGILKYFQDNADSRNNNLPNSYSLLLSSVDPPLKHGEFHSVSVRLVTEECEATNPLLNHS